MSARDATILVIASISIILIVYDIVVVFFNKESNDSISAVMRSAGKFGFAPYGWGALGAHFWFPGNWLMGPLLSFIMLMSVGILISFAHYFWLADKRYGKWFSLAWFLVGIPCGRVFFPLGP